MIHDAENKRDEARREKLRRYLAERGLRSTRQRDLIVEAFFRQGHRHVNAEELHRTVRQRDPSIGVATIYRTLRLLTECGVATARHFGDGQAVYEVVDQHHDHLICTGCGRIVEFENEAIESLQVEVAHRHGFSITHHKLELYGLCDQCAGADAQGTQRRDMNRSV
jgi:Fur family ferric uptake transcriptional regulator